MERRCCFTGYNTFSSPSHGRYTNDRYQWILQLGAGTLGLIVVRDNAQTALQLSAMWAKMSVIDRVPLPWRRRFSDGA